MEEKSAHFQCLVGNRSPQVFWPLPCRSSLSFFPRLKWIDLLSLPVSRRIAIVPVLGRCQVWCGLFFIPGQMVPRHFHACVFDPNVLENHDLGYSSGGVFVWTDMPGRQLVQVGSDFYGKEARETGSSPTMLLSRSCLCFAWHAALRELNMFPWTTSTCRQHFSKAKLVT